MYQIEAWSALGNAVRGLGSRHPRQRVGRDVLALGFTSLLTDVSSEMVATVLPIYLVLHLGLTPLHFGVVDGLYNGATALLRIVGGLVADRARRYKQVAAVGYSLSAACRVGLLAAGNRWPLVAGMVALDRAAKGLRTAPRDALISLSSERASLAASFGVHRAMDSAGAMLGPLVALMILAVLPTGFDVLFVASFGIAVVGVGVLLLFVDNKAAPPHEPARPPLSIGAFRHVFEDKGLRALTVAAVVLSMVTVSDGFLYLVLQQRVGFRAGLVPLLYVGTAAFYLLIAIPAGRLADRVGRRATFVAGYALLAVGYLAALGGELGGASVGLCVFSLGAYYAMTDGVLMALASALLPGHTLGTGLAVLTTLTSLGRFTGSVVFGALWTSYGVTISLIIFLAALLCAMATASVVLRRSKAADDQRAPVS